jgi:hypothetical protein
MLKHVQEKQREAKLGKRDATKMSFSPPTGPRADKDRDAMDVDDPIEGKGKNRKYVVILEIVSLHRYLLVLTGRQTHLRDHYNRGSETGFNFSLDPCIHLTTSSSS